MNTNIKTIINDILETVRPLQFTQFTVDFVDKYTCQEPIVTETDLGAFTYAVNNILEVVDKERTDYDFYFTLSTLLNIMPTLKENE